MTWNNVNQYDFTDILYEHGTDKQALVDIRGMGETASSNVLVMVDGFRLNPPDLAGPDFSTIAIDEIERIEIVRGAASVVYGSGAVGGVINIVTKRGKKEPSARLYSAYGSYDTFDGRASGGGQIQNLNFSVNADYYDTDGYRDNGFLRKKDAGIFHLLTLTPTTKAIRITSTLPVPPAVAGISVRPGSNPKLSSMKGRRVVTTRSRIFWITMIARMSPIPPAASARE